MDVRFVVRKTYAVIVNNIYYIRRYTAASGFPTNGTSEWLERKNYEITCTITAGVHRLRSTWRPVADSSSPIFLVTARRFCFWRRWINDTRNVEETACSDPPSSPLFDGVHEPFLIEFIISNLPKSFRSLVTRFPIR